MLVKIEEIDEDGLVLDEPVSERLLSEALTHGKDTGFRADRPASLKASLRKISGRVLLTGDLSAHLTAPCKRCVKEVAVDLPVHFTLNLVPEPAAAKDGEGGEGEAEDARSQKRASGGSFALGDADREYFDGRTIDLDPIVKEQVLLALPVSVVCKDDCKGLCPQCGQDLNEAECGCERKVVDPRLAVLRTIKLN